MARYSSGAGPRLCIGNQFALMEMQILLALFARRFTLKAPPAKPVGLQPLITLRPKQLIQLVPERR
nr:cytochrome P450 [uncultured Arsenicibacter sp.]